MMLWEFFPPTKCPFSASGAVLRHIASASPPLYPCVCVACVGALFCGSRTGSLSDFLALLKLHLHFKLQKHFLYETSKEKRYSTRLKDGPRRVKLITSYVLPHNVQHVHNIAQQCSLSFHKRLPGCENRGCKIVLRRASTTFHTRHSGGMLRFCFNTSRTCL